MRQGRSGSPHNVIQGRSGSPHNALYSSSLAQLRKSRTVSGESVPLFGSRPVHTTLKSNAHWMHFRWMRIQCVLIASTLYISTTVQSLLVCAVSICKSHGVVWQSLAWSSVLFAPGKLLFCCAGYGQTGLLLVFKNSGCCSSHCCSCTLAHPQMLSRSLYLLDCDR